MGLLKLSQFSSQPNLKAKVDFKTKQIQQGRDLVPFNKFESLVENGKLIFISHEIDNAATETMYTVPSGKSFYLIAASIFGVISATGHVASLSVDDNDLLLGIINLGSAQQNWSIPLKFPQGTNFTVSCPGVNNDAFIMIQGYEVAEAASQQVF